MPQSRRRMLRGSAALLTGGVVGAGLVSSIGGQATAAEADLSLDGDEVTVQNGSIAAVWLTLGVGWEYAVPSGKRPDVLEIEVQAGTEPDTLTSVATTTSDQAFLQASGEEQFEVDLLDAGIVDAESMVPAAGETAETIVHVGVEMRLRDESGLVIAADSATAPATIAVEKSEYDPTEHGAVAGAGSVTVELG